MKSQRTKYFIVILIVMLFGLMSRHIKGIPLWPGDVLWAMMVFYMVRFLMVKSSLRLVALISLAFCYFIEVSQLYQAPWVNNIRHTVLGGLVLGLVFSWDDLLCYSVGVCICFAAETLIRQITDQ